MLDAKSLKQERACSKETSAAGACEGEGGGGRWSGRWLRIDHTGPCRPMGVWGLAGGGGEVRCEP